VHPVCGLILARESSEEKSEAKSLTIGILFVNRATEDGGPTFASVPGLSGVGLHLPVARRPQSGWQTAERAAWQNIADYR